jgi:hypothetical protein
MGGMWYGNEAGAIVVIIIAVLAVAALTWFVRRERM